MICDLFNTLVEDYFGTLIGKIDLQTMGFVFFTRFQKCTSLAMPFFKSLPYFTPTRKTTNEEIQFLPLIYLFPVLIFFYQFWFSLDLIWWLKLFRVHSKFISLAEAQGNLSSTFPFEIQSCKNQRIWMHLTMKKYERYRATFWSKKMHIGSKRKIIIRGI